MACRPSTPCFAAGWSGWRSTGSSPRTSLAGHLDLAQPLRGLQHRCAQRAGNVDVYRSLFLRSKIGDVTINNLGDFSLVGNTSVDSKNFANWASNHSWGTQVLVQGNRIYDTKDDFAVVTGSAGPWLLVDNMIRNRPGYSGPSVSATANDQTLVG
jgi:hypothetical protein